MATILTILPEGFEEIEAVAPIDLWRRAGYRVTIASLSSKKWVTGRNGITLEAESSLSAVGPETVFDVLFLPGGPGVEHLRSSPEVREIVGRQILADKLIAAICAAPLVLKDAGLLGGRKYTAHPSTQNELTEIMGNAAVVMDGNIITSRGAGTASEMALKVIEVLSGAKSAAKIREEICSN